ncbi:MAG: DNA polymerase III subunit delta [Gemmatimonadota bacterium]|nr:MAG: DNA polymerase III subunit delta [Gemmatimonadota bacterium]
MKYGDLLKEIQKGNLEPVYLFHGEEDFLKEEILEKISEVLVDSSTKDFNYDVLYGGETDAATAVDIASSFPMMAERRLVIYRDIQRCTPKDKKIFFGYAENPARTTCLVLVGPKMDVRKGFFKDLSKRVTTVVFWPLFDNEIPTWIRKRVQARGMQISQDALVVLQNYVGSNLRELANEIDKLAVYTDERTTIDRKDVETVVGITKSNSVFDFAGAVAERRLNDSLHILHSLLETGESGVGLVSVLTKHYVTLTKVHQLYTSGVSTEEIAQGAKIRPFVVRSYIQQVRDMTQPEFEHAFQCLLEADKHLKSSYQNPRFVMQLLIYRLCRFSGNV